MLLPQRVEICFPKKIDKLGNGFFGHPAMIAKLKMVPVEKFYMLHTRKLAIAKPVCN
jgi:hypothetical protein